MHSYTPFTHMDNMGVDGGFDALDYSYASAPASGRNTRVNGERDLWCAVIAQAFFDMGVIAPPTSHSPHASRAGKNTFNDAARWLLHNDRSFVFVCDLAGVSPHVIRRAARLFYNFQIRDSF